MLMATLAVAQLIGWSGRAHYLCFAADGTLRGIDGGPNACFYNDHGSSNESDHEEGDHLLLAVDNLSASARISNAALAIDLPIDRTFRSFEALSLTICEEVSFVCVSLPLRVHLIERSTVVRRC
jgi:hypothetical protein